MGRRMLSWCGQRRSLPGIHPPSSLRYILPMSLPAGSRLGHYEIIAPLGAGGMGEVYRARDPRLKRDIAIKVLPAEMASSPDWLARFEREATTVAGLNHPNIVTLYSIEEDAGTRFLTMELVEGRSLADVVTAGGLPLTQLLDLAIPIADGLVAAHERGVVHRDLKPANVMVTRGGRVKVLDFGLAKLTQTEPPQTTQAPTMGAPLSMAGEVVGTVPYMAPEQILGQAVDGRTDLFSFGILVYELATGKRPFAGQTSWAVTAAIARDSPPSVTTVRSDLPVELQRIIERCLEKQPRERFQSALDVVNELRSVRRTLERGEPAPRPKSDKIASIAVLPFVNRSASADDEYFSDGLADELLNVLAKIKGLRVVARTSSFQFKGTKDDIATIGAKLDVATVLEGSVRKAGQRVRISVQLVRVADSSHLWSESYDRTLDDIFAVQDDIARSVVKELRITLLGEEVDSHASGEVKAEVSKAAKGRATDPEAHRLYLLGRYLLDRGTRDETSKAIGYLGQALERDPEFALAWSELGRAHWREAGLGWTPQLEGYVRAREAVERSLKMEPDLPEGHARLGTIQMDLDWDWRGAEASFARALDLTPGNLTVLSAAARFAYFMGRIDEAILLACRAIEQDPLNGIGYNNLGAYFHAASRFEEAEQALRKALELAPQRIRTNALLALTALAQGRGDEAVAVAQLEPEEAYRLWALVIVHDAIGQGPESDAALRMLIEKYADDSAYQIAGVHAARNEADDAFAWLERAYTQRDTGLTGVKVEPWFRSLHGDPRWGAFLMKMGLDA
jgi:eukaryotic-like serine/threonine-protein kinase